MTSLTYITPLLPEYAGNPLIEALPPMGRTDEEILKAMGIRPAFSLLERELPTSTRREMAYRLTSLFIPLPSHVQLFEDLSIWLRRSYSWRNPLDPKTQAFLHHPGASAVAGEFQAMRATSSFLLFLKGVSGIGKSRAIEACLRALGPQVLRHRNYNGTVLCESQVVWAKVSCPEDRSLKSLCLLILQAVDAALGEKKYAPQYLADRRTATGMVVNAVFECLANEHVGVLAVDEIQNLFASKGQPALEMLNFLLRLKDESGICLVLCGTYASLELLNQKFRLSRRVAGGEVELKRPASPQDEEWCSFAEILWGYQWLRKPLEYDVDHGETLFYLTQGIRGLVVWLFILAQDDALRRGVETLTSDMLRATWRRRFGQLEPAMAALRSGDAAALAEWDDLCDALTLQKLLEQKKGNVFNPNVGRNSAADNVTDSRGQPKGDGDKKKVKPQPDPSLQKLTAEGGLDALRSEGVVGVPE